MRGVSHMAGVSILKPEEILAFLKNTCHNKPESNKRVRFMFENSHIDYWYESRTLEIVWYGDFDNDDDTDDYDSIAGNIDDTYIVPNDTQYSFMLYFDVSEHKRIGYEVTYRE